MTRIIAGAARGRRLTAPPGSATRPTADRVRESFFAAIAAWNGSVDAGAGAQLSGLGFADLFAGTGAMGLEAASRGAAPVLLCDNDRQAVATIRQNLTATGLAADVRAVSVASLVANAPPVAFDVVWCDPPYALGNEVLDPLLERVVTGGWVAGDGVIVVERSARAPSPTVPGCEHWTRPYGETVLHWFAPSGEPT